jgi:hypothetical protein
MAVPRSLAVAFLLASLLVLSVALPASAQAASPGIRNPSEPSPVTLYMHVLDIQDMPINTQRPDDLWTVSNPVGLGTSTTTCIPPDTPAVNLHQQWHTYYGYSSPSYVEYQIEQSGKPRIHPERGISYDAHLDAGTPFTLYWYMTTQSLGAAGSGAVDPSVVPVVVPNVQVSATIRAGDAISVDDRAYNTGPVLVQGGTVPATLAADQVLPAAPGLADPVHTRALGQQADGKWLYEFAVPMAIEEPVIPRDTGYNLRIDVRMDNPACTGLDEAVMPNVVRVHSDAAHRPRLEFAVTNPLRIEALHPQFVGDDLVVHAAMNAAWGNYDIAEVNPYTPEVTADDLQLSIRGPTDAAGLYLANMVQSTNPHYMHQDAVTLAFVWPYKADQAVDGVYTVSLLVRNDQGTATATADAVFELGRGVTTVCDLEDCRTEGPGPRGSGNEAPGPAAVAGPLALLGVGAALRQRRRD